MGKYLRAKNRPYDNDIRTTRPWLGSTNEIHERQARLEALVGDPKGEEDYF
ncbi:conserved hypothetical protein [Ricinus communis]|uniref:Uncharacterized protein n=1 Tax=Ricinus communis TaxID=3988 RepID=B9SP96_RICCO|nr:conserved hypothetical protein [Ricinus communis]